MTDYDTDKLYSDILMLTKQFPQDLKKQLQSSTAYGLYLIKTQYPKGRSGEARKSFLSKKINDFSYQIYSKIIQTQVLEFGTKAHTVLPKRKKMLSIPIDKSVLVANGYRLKKMTMKQYWDNVKSGKIVRAKSAHIPAIAAKKPLSRIFVPKIYDNLISGIIKLVNQKFGSKNG